VLALALCLERTGRYASAWSTFRDAVALARRDGRKDREDIARVRAEKMERAAPRISLDIPGHVKNLDGLVVELDGTVLTAPAWDSVLRVDPGVHTIQAVARGYRPWKDSIELRDSGVAIRVSIPALTQEPESIPRSNEKGPVAPASRSTRTERAHFDVRRNVENGTSNRAIPYFLVGAGTALVGVGAYFGVRALDRAGNLCDEEVCPTHQRDDYLDYRRSADTANVAVGVGLLSVGAGIALLLLDSSRMVRKSAPRATRNDNLRRSSYARVSAGAYTLLHEPRVLIGW
jgi:hypothetical protein